jgi:hypothetical protein
VSRLALPVVAGIVLSMAMALVGQAAGTIERDHVARVTRGATNRAHRLEADCHGPGDAADITAPADVAGDDGRIPAASDDPLAQQAPASACILRTLALAPPGTLVWLPLLSFSGPSSQASATDSLGRAPPSA